MLLGRQQPLFSKKLKVPKGCPSPMKCVKWVEWPGNPEPVRRWKERTDLT